jgi:hypothetical protein
MPALPDYADEFDTIGQYWHFEQLCKDLAQYKPKKKPLSERETKWLKGLLLGYKPKEITKIVGDKGSSGSTRTALSNHLYPLITALIYEKVKQSVKPGSSRMLICLERSGYRKALMTCPETFDASPRLSQFATEQFEIDQPQLDTPSTTSTPSVNSWV